MQEQQGGLGAAVAGEESGVKRLEILHLVASGLSNKQIARRLGISHQTVGYHLGKLLTSCGASNRASLVSCAYLLGVLQAPGREHQT